MNIAAELPQHILLLIMCYACEYNKRAYYHLVNRHWNKSLLCLQEVLRGNYACAKRKNILCLEKEMNSFSRMFVCKHLSKHIDPSARNNWAIQLAARNGYLDVVKYLVELHYLYPDWEPAKRIDPSSLSNHAIALAAKCGHLNIVKYLVELHDLYPGWGPANRIDPSAGKNYIVIFAAEYGHLDIVKYLVELRYLYPEWKPAKRIDPSARDNSAILRAAENGHLDTVKYLLSVPRVKSTLPEELIKRYKSAVVSSQSIPRSSSRPFYLEI